MTHGGLQVYVRASQRDTSPSSPLSLAGKKKKLFCIGGINSRHLDAARNRDFGGSINFKTDWSCSDPVQKAVCVQEIEVLLLPIRFIANIGGLRGFCRLESPLYI